jgi:hypothetical protein
MEVQKMKSYPEHGEASSSNIKNTNGRQEMRSKWLALGFVLVLSALILSGCGSSEAEPTALPTAVPTEVATEQPTEVPTATPTEVAVEAPDPVRARDVALAYVSGRYGEQAPTLGLTWAEENITPEGLVGSSSFQYTAGDWVVTVSFPLVAPQATIYQVVATNQTTGFQWEGKVDAAGQVTEALAPTGGQPVVGWGGFVVSLPADGQFDDYLALEPEGAGGVGLTGTDSTVEAQIQMLRDSTTYAHFWGTLNCPALDYGGCELVVTRLREDRPGPFFDPDPVEGWEGTIVGNPPGSQFDDYFVLAGDFPVGFGIGSSDPTLATQLESLRDTGATIRVWGQVTCGIIDAYGSQIQVTRIEVVGPPAPTSPPAPTPTPVQSWTEPVENWWGEIVSNPPGSQFDDYFQRQIVNGGQYGIESLDPDIQAQIVALRDTGTTVFVWGTLHHNVPDYNASQIQVTRLEVQEVPAPPEITEEPVDGWIGTIIKYPILHQLDDYFERDDGQRFGIGTIDAAVRQQIETLRWTGAQVQVWGQLRTGVPDAENRQIQVERIEAVSGPAEEARNLSPFAEPSASSVLPSDRWGTYAAFSAIDSFLSSPWTEGVDGPGVGEWIMLTFPGTVEVYSIGIDVGYDRDEDDTLRSPEVFTANNRLKRATLIFSNGEQIELTFSDSRGVQMIHLARAPGPNIETTFVKVVIEEVYPGSKYDDTCLAEIEVWGKTK